MAKTASLEDFKNIIEAIVFDYMSLDKEHDILRCIRGALKDLRQRVTNESKNVLISLTIEQMEKFVPIGGTRAKVWHLLEKIKTASLYPVCAKRDFGIKPSPFNYEWLADRLMETLYILNSSKSKKVHTTAMNAAVRNIEYALLDCAGLCEFHYKVVFARDYGYTTLNLGPELIKQLDHFRNHYGFKSINLFLTFLFEPTGKHWVK